LLLLRILIGRNLPQISLKIAGIFAKVVQQPDHATGRPDPDFLSSPSRCTRYGH
jgi:hypothetical protein